MAPRTCCNNCGVPSLRAMLAMGVVPCPPRPMPYRLAKVDTKCSTCFPSCAGFMMSWSSTCRRIASSASTTGPLSSMSSVSFSRPSTSFMTSVTLPCNVWFTSSSLPTKSAWAAALPPNRFSACSTVSFTCCTRAKDTLALTSKTALARLALSCSRTSVSLRTSSSSLAAEVFSKLRGASHLSNDELTLCSSMFAAVTKSERRCNSVES
mmetsp:Transcript_66745/g.215078  ORF Transcript_66745/g.215078 Transcript_66745/m.215078 type:complete len:209 (-) Transcript_66745:612-1238(-)